VLRTRNPWLSLRIAYGSQKGKLFNEEEDRFLICMTHHLGYGRWDDLREEVRKSWLFRFDWFIKTRSAQELQRRVDVLIRCIEKENAELAEAEAESARKGKKDSGASAKKVSPDPGPSRPALPAAARALCAARAAAATRLDSRARLDLHSAPHSLPLDAGRRALQDARERQAQVGRRLRQRKEGQAVMRSLARGWLMSCMRSFGSPGRRIGNGLVGRRRWDGTQHQHSV
jgi:hypothetical protein